MQKYIKSIISACIILLFISHPIGIFHLPLLDQIENFTYDTRLKYTAPYTVDTNVVILDIDEKRIISLRDGKVPFFEPDLTELLIKTQKSGCSHRHSWQRYDDRYCAGSALHRTSRKRSKKRFINKCRIRERDSTVTPINF